MSIVVTSVLPLDELRSKDGFMECVEEYKKCCICEGAMPEEEFNFTPYQEMEKQGTLICMGIFANNKCVGFVGLVRCPYPHLGQPYLAVESVFILEQYRGKCWNKVLKHIKEVALEEGCCGVISSAQSGSRFDYYLSLKYTPMNTLYWINIHDK